jgi:hypothetical protein
MKTFFQLLLKGDKANSGRKFRLSGRLWLCITKSYNFSAASALGPFPSGQGPVDKRLALIYHYTSYPVFIGIEGIEFFLNLVCSSRATTSSGGKIC